MKIGIIGAGAIGGTLAKHLVARGHDVVIANSRGAATLADVAKETGAIAVTATEATQGRDLLIVTIPQKAVPDLPQGFLAEVPKDVVVIDTGNYYPVRDGHLVPLHEGVPESEWVGTYLGRPVVKAFNNIAAASLRDKAMPAKSPGRIALPVAGDDAAAKAKAMALVEEIGFDAVDAGSIAESWRQEPGTPCYGTDLDAAGVKEALAAATHDGRADCRVSADGMLRSYLASLSPQP